MKERDINKNRKIKKKPYKQFLEFTIQIRIYLDNYTVKISHKIVAFIIILSIIQETSFLLDNYNSNSTKLSNFMQCLNILMIFTRPYKILSMNFFELSYLIPLILQITYWILIIKLFIVLKLTKKSQKNLESIFLQQNRLFIFIMIILSYFQALQYHIFFINQIELIVESITYSQKLQSVSIQNILFAIISLILVILNMVIEMICNLEQNSKLQPTFGIMQQSFTFYWRQISMLIIVFLNKLNFSQDLKFFIIFSILFFKILFSTQTQLLYYVTTYQKSKYTIISQITQLSVSIILLILKIISNTNLDSNILIVCIPIVIKVVKDIYYNLHINIICNRRNSKNAYEKQYKITEICFKYGELQKSFIKCKQDITIIYNFIYIHQQNCTYTSCKCKNEQSSFESLILIYLKEQIKEFGYLVNITRDPSAKQQLFLRYLFFICYLGMNTKAFQQSNIKVYQDSEINSKSNIQSYQRSDQRVESFNSQDQKSDSISRQKIEMESDEFQFIKIHKFNIVQQIKLNFLQEQIKQKLSIGLSQSDSLKENLEHAVNLFLISEDGNRKLIQKIIQCLNRKRLYLTNLLQDNSKIFDQSKPLLIKLKKVENELLTLYDNFPSKKMQALNTFFQSEIMNNQYNAFKLSCIASISDEKLLKMQSQINFDLFSSKVNYIIFGFEQKTHHLEIQSCSNKINNFFCLTQEQFKQVQFIEQILPQGFEQIHYQLVQNFLVSGQSKYFREINLSFCKIFNRQIKPIQFFFDMNLSNFNNMKFVSFLQDTQISSAFIFCGANNKIICITKNISQKLGFSQKLSQTIIDKLCQQQIQKIFPRFNTIYDSYYTKGSILNKEQQQSDYFQEKQNTIDQSANQITMIIPDFHNLECRTKTNQNQNENNTIQYTVDAVFHFRNILQDFSQYLIVEIRDAKKQILTEVSTPFQSVLPQSTNNNLEFLTSYSDLDKNFEIVEDQESYCFSPPRALEFQINNNNKEYFGSKLKLSNDFTSIQQLQNISISIPLVSPKDSSARLIEDLTILQKENDDNKQDKNKIQKYFSSIEKNEGDNSSQIVSSIRKVQQKNMNEQDANISESEINQNNVEESDQKDISRKIKIMNKNTDGTSEAGIKKSRLSKKYELIYKITTSDNFSYYFVRMKYLIILMFITFIIFGIIEIFFSQNDLPQFLKELDLLQIKANIIGPIDNYIVGQNAVTNYATLYEEGVYTLEETKFWAQYANNEIRYTYGELKTSFENQLQNPYLDPFFKDRYIEVEMANYPTINKYNIRVRQAIQLELQAALKFIEMDFLDDKSIDYTQGFFTYLLKNYKAFRELFQKLNLEMLNYSIDRASTVSSNWYQLLIPIIIGSAILLIATFISYRFYLSQYDQIIDLFRFVNNNKVSKDLERIRNFTNLFVQDSDMLYKFQFDIFEKENQLLNVDQNKEIIQQNLSQIKDKQKISYFGLQQKMSWLPSLFAFLLVFGVCFIFCFISNSLAQNYFKKYPETTKFFNLLSDLSMASSGVFAMREISYSIQGEQQIYYFFPNKDASYFIDIFFYHVEIINSFLQQITKFDTSGYITSDTFVNNFNDLMSLDVCSFLPDYKIEGAQMHCDIALDGVMRQGMVQTLNEIRNSLLAEFQTSNNFTNEIISINQDLEIGLMSYDNLNDLRDQFQNQLTTSTNQLIDQLISLNISFLIILFISILILVFFIESYYKWEFQLIKQFIILLPQETLFLDNQLDRNLRQLVVKENLI